ncbi:MAG TPA: MoxR family ATPase [Actinophytocola sp.]|uniref:AAA family ATPase n=1 Tax=Actinophytocola sp. TaxID=1872138 RepID=UPI002DDCC174|nr:MoxR family ATPase [Actinophytocola sp.]HEV2778305.1 MoxR family ATPase [Actinophytocola sp.]
MSINEHPGEVRPAPDWWIYRGTGRPIHDIQVADLLPPPPPWRNFRGGPLPAHDAPPDDDQDADRRLGVEFHLAERHVDPHEVDMVNAALYLRRPLLVTGRPGVGKSSLAYRIARELRLGRVLRWSITSQTTLKMGLYEYDAIGRAQAAATVAARRGLDGDDPMEPLPQIGEYIRLGRLGTAFLPSRLPRVLLIDELDKSEADLPNDLLSIFEDGDFLIPELERMRHHTREVTVHTADPGMTATIVDGRVRCRAFPMTIITSNGEREFPAAFLRRCLRLEIKDPNPEQLAAMVANHMLDPHGEHRDRLVADFVTRSATNDGLPADRLLEAVYLATSGAYRANDEAWQRLIDALWRRLNPHLVP